MGATTLKILGTVVAVIGTVASLAGQMIGNVQRNAEMDRMIEQKLDERLSKEEDEEAE